MRRLLGLLLAAALWPSAAAAREVRLRAEVDAQKIGVEDRLQLTITLEGEVSRDIPYPTLRNLQVVQGPMVSTQLAFVNGAMSQSKSLTYVLQPLQPGRAEVGSVRVGDQSTAPIAVDVQPGSLRPRASRRPPPDPFGDPFGGDPFGGVFSRRPRAAPKVFVEVVPSRTQLYVGEPLVLTYYLYTQTSVTDLSFQDPPKYPGFWSEDLEKPQVGPEGEVVQVQGDEYHRFPVLRRLLFPTRAGKLSIPPATLRLGLPRQSIFDGGGQAVERPVQAVAIAALATPEAPGFAGAVGRFTASAGLDRSTVPLGEAATLRFSVEGSGNLKWVDQGPELAVPGAKVYPPQVRADLKATEQGLVGSKTWEYVVVPETAASLEVPPLAFTYFDPSAGKLTTARTAPLPLVVQGGSGPAGGAAPALARTGPLTSGGGLALRSELDLPPAALPALGGQALGLLLGAALGLHGLLWAGFRLADRRAAADGRSAPRGSVRAALGELARVGRHGASKEASAALIEKALHDAFGSALDDPAADGERERAARAVLQEVQFIRYAPQLGDYSEKLREVAARAADVVKRWA